MLQKLVGDSVVLQTSLKGNLPNVAADPHLIEHVLINLVLNAREALSLGGRLTISTSTIRVDEGFDKADYRIAPGEYVCFGVEDNGCGMTPEVQAHVFEPFFTTREVGRGTGLGLASIYGTVKQHSGWVEFTSETGVGTEFRVFLPLAPAAPLAVPVKPAMGIPRSGKTILLVEPNDRSRAMARFILERWGYRIIEVDSASIALLFWEQQSANIDLLITELSLPKEQCGKKLANRLRQSKPSLKVIYTSEPEPNQAASSAGELLCLSKPFNPDKLLRMVSEALSGKTAPAESHDTTRFLALRIGNAQVLPTQPTSFSN
jgi:CheY-like chemotaxis protein